MAEYLISNGANINEKGFNTPLHNGSLTLIFIIYLKNLTQLFKASLSGKVKLVKRLIEEGAKINEKDGNGQIPLHSGFNLKNLK